MLVGRGLAEACGNRTHPGRLSATRNGFEARENHQAPCASVIETIGQIGLIGQIGPVRPIFSFPVFSRSAVDQPAP